jgi:hypothetical protein
MPISFTCRGARWTKRPFEHLPAQAICLRMTPEFLFIYSFDFGCTTIWYVLYVLSLSWRVHACLHRDSAKWLTSFPFLWLTNIPTVAWPKSTTGRLMLL